MRILFMGTPDFAVFTLKGNVFWNNLFSGAALCLLVIAVLVLGVVSYLKMTPDLLPNMDFPYVMIMTTYPGASPEKVEQELIKIRNGKIGNIKVNNFIRLVKMNVLRNGFGKEENGKNSENKIRQIFS